MDDGNEPIADDELLYRRVPVSTGWYNPETAELKSEAFAPHKINDATGLSVSRAKYKSAVEAARGQPGKMYFVAVVRTGDLRVLGIAVEPRPLPGDPGHAELPDLNSDRRKSDITLERQRILVKKTLRVEGPFATE
ncbi:MAG: hypothetical protein K8T89_00075 [Planctomycetes bacterium]|nr:hypothetical protein [Planctomycetota bacterium]